MSDVMRPGGKSLAVSDGKALQKEPTHPTILEFESPTRALIALPAPLSARIVAPLIAGLVICSIAAVAVIPIDIAVTAQGRLNTKGATFVVQPLDTSIIRRIGVHEGQVVKAGEILATLDPTLTSADVSAYQSSVRSLGAEVARLQAEADSKPYIAGSDDAAQQQQAALYMQRHAQYTAMMDSYRQKIASLETQIAGNLAMENFYRERLVVAQNVENMREQLERLQVGSHLNSLAAADSRLEMQRNMVNSQASAATGKANLQEMVAERDQDQRKWYAQVSQDLTDKGRLLSDARENLNKASLHGKMVDLRAPEDAIVLSVAHVSVGSVLQSGDQFITLTPADAPLEAQVFISGGDSGWAQVGDTAVIKLDSFSYTNYGYAEGRVQVLSPDSFTSADADPSTGDPGRVNTRNNPAASQPVAYRATVSLDKLSFHNTPPDFRLRPGMPITADIKVGKRTVLTAMLARFVPAFSEGLREP